MLLIFSARALADGPCNPTDPPQEPASGKWRGTLDQRASYQQNVGPASVKIGQSWHGDLEFVLGHDTEYDERYVPEPPCMRVPAGRAPIEGCRADGTRIDPTKKFKVVRVPKDGAPRLSGEARVTQLNTVSTSVRGAEGRGGGSSPQAESLNTELVLAGGKIDAISLVGRTDQLRTTTAFSVTDRTSGETASSRGTAGADGLPYERQTGQGRGGSFSASSRRNAAGDVSTHAVVSDPDGKTRIHDLQTPGNAGSSGNPTQFVQLFHLTLDTRECAFMKGTIDPAALQRMRGAGFSVEISQAEWSAELQERDKAFEAEVSQFAAEPVPATLTWDYLDRFNSRLQQLQSAKKSDYGRCVLGKAVSKAIRVQMQALRTLTASYPDRCQGATDAVLNVANMRLLELARPLGYMGLDKCADVQKAVDLVLESASPQTKTCR